MKQLDCNLFTDKLHKVTGKRTAGVVRELDKVLEDLLTRPYGGPGLTITGWNYSSPGYYTASVNISSYNTNATIIVPAGTKVIFK